MLREKETTAIMIGSVLVVVALTIIFTRSYIHSRPLEDVVTEDSRSSARDTTNFPLIKPVELEQLLRERQSSLALIDIRTTTDFAAVHIPQSKNLLGSTLTQQQLQTLPQDIVVIIGYDNAQLEDPLFSQKPSGQKRIVYLDGGFARWEQESASVISQGDPQKIEDHAKMRSLSRAELQEIVDAKNSTYAIIDVRDSTEFARGAVPGAMNIPLAQIEAREREVPHGKILIVYGQGDLPGFQGAVRLYDLGFLGVKILTGGFDTWQNIKTTPEPTPEETPDETVQS